MFYQADLLLFFLLDNKYYLYTININIQNINKNNFF